MPHFFTSPPDVLPAATSNSTWHDIDVSSHAQGTDTIVAAVFLVENDTNTYTAVVMRKKGQSYDPYQSGNRSLGRYAAKTQWVGVDGSEIAQIIWSAKPTGIWLIAYFTSDDVVIHSEPVKREPGTGGVYSTYTVSGSPSDCVGVFGSIESSVTNMVTYDWGIRFGGASFNHYQQVRGGGLVAGVNGSYQYELKRTSTISGPGFYETGYFKSGSGFVHQTTPEQIVVPSLSDDNLWYNIVPANPRSGAEALVLSPLCTLSAYAIHVREGSSSWTPENEARGYPGGSEQGAATCVALDGSDSIDIYMGHATRTELRLIGDFVSGGGSTPVDVVAGVGIGSGSGNAPTIAAGVEVTAGNGAGSGKGREPDPSTGVILSLGASIGTGTGHPPSVTIGVEVVAGSDTATATGHDPVTVTGHIVVTSTATAAGQGHAPTTTTGSSVSVTAGIGAGSGVGLSPTSSIGHSVSVGVGVGLGGGNAPLVVSGIEVTAGQGTSTGSGNVPTVTIGHSPVVASVVAPGTGYLVNPVIGSSVSVGSVTAIGIGYQASFAAGVFASVEQATALGVGHQVTVTVTEVVSVGGIVTFTPIVNRTTSTISVVVAGVDAQVVLPRSELTAVMAGGSSFISAPNASLKVIEP